MNLLVTGGAGFIGSNLIRHIIDFPEIHRLVNLDCLTYAGHAENVADVASHPKYHFEKVDLRDKCAVTVSLRKHRVSHVIHLAAESHVDRSIEAPTDFIQTNIVGTFNLLEACRDRWTDIHSSSKKSPRFLHVSTDEVYGSLGATGRVNEASPYAPNSPYSASKAASDFLVRAAYHTYGLPVVTLHCSNNYGPYQFPEKLIPMTIQSILAGRSIPVYGDGMNVRDWLHVKDHTGALWRTLQRGRLGETYGVGGGNEQANLRLVEWICDLMDELAPESCQKSRSLITFVKDRAGHDRRYSIDSTKIQAELGWAPGYTFETGLRETICWYLEHQQWIQKITKSRDQGLAGVGSETI